MLTHLNKYKQAEIPILFLFRDVDYVLKEPRDPAAVAATLGRVKTRGAKVVATVRDSVVEYKISDHFD